MSISISKFFVTINLKALIALKGSSLKDVFAFIGHFKILFDKSLTPSKGSIRFPFSSSAIALILKSLLSRSSYKFPISTEGCLVFSSKYTSFLHNTKSAVKFSFICPFGNLALVVKQDGVSKKISKPSFFNVIFIIV